MFDVRASLIRSQGAVWRSDAVDRFERRGDPARRSAQGVAQPRRSAWRCEAGGDALEICDGGVHQTTWMCVEHLATDPVEGGARSAGGWTTAPDAPGIGASPTRLGDPIATYGGSA